MTTPLRRAAAWSLCPSAASPEAAWAGAVADSHDQDECAAAALDDIVPMVGRTAQWPPISRPRRYRWLIPNPAAACVFSISPWERAGVRATGKGNRRIGSGYELSSEPSRPPARPRYNAVTEIVGKTRLA